MNHGKTVAVTGASGFVGRHVVAELLGKGYSVRALVRSRAKALGVLPRQGVELVEGNVLAAGLAETLVSGAAACVHLIGIIREEADGQTFQRMHVQATRAVVEACQARGGGGCGRLVHMSALGVGPEGKSKYQKTKWEAEQIVRRSGSGGARADGGEGIEWTIVRPSLIHGADGEFVQMVKGLASGQEQPWYFIPYFTRGLEDTRVPLGAVRQESAVVSPIAVEDVAAAIVSAIGNPHAVGEVYNLVGPDVMTWPEILAALRDHIPGTRPELKPFGIPGVAAVGIAKAAGALGLGRMLPFDEGQAYMAMEDSTAERSKVERQLGLRPRPFLEALEAYGARV